MSDELLRETNDLMKRLLELREADAKQRSEEKAAAAKQLEEWETGREEREKQWKMPSMDDFQEKHEVKLADLKAKAEEAQVQEIEYRQELLAELRRQNELLEQIVERLES